MFYKYSYIDYRKSHFNEQNSKEIVLPVICEVIAKNITQADSMLYELFKDEKDFASTKFSLEKSYKKKKIDAPVTANMIVETLFWLGVKITPVDFPSFVESYSVMA